MINSILLIDDDEKFAQSFTNEAAYQSIHVIHGKSHEQMLELLPKCHHKIAAVILDIKCLLTNDQAVESPAFIGAALSSLDKKYKTIPRLVLTGDDYELKIFRHHWEYEKVFLKNPLGIKNLFDEISFYKDHHALARFKFENKEIFALLEEMKFGYEAEQLFNNLIEAGFEEDDFNKFKNICREIRGFQEIIYKTINQRNKAVVPDSKFKANGMIDFNDLMKHLSGYPDNRHNPTRIVYQNNTILNISKFIYWSCGEYVHENPERDYKISKNTIKALVYSLMELLLWAQRYLTIKTST